jgi:hypothetical protein
VIILRMRVVPGARTGQSRQIASVGPGTKSGSMSAAGGQWSAEGHTRRGNKLLTSRSAPKQDKGIPGCSPPHTASTGAVTMSNKGILEPANCAETIRIQLAKMSPPPPGSSLVARAALTIGS